MQHARKIAGKDRLIWQLLKDGHYRVTGDGRVMTNLPRRGGLRRSAEWREAGYPCPSRGGSRAYWRLKYRGQWLYRSRIIFAATNGRLDPRMTVDHINMNTLDDRPQNLRELTGADNSREATRFYRVAGITAAELKASWVAGGQPQHWRGRNAAKDSYR